MNFARDVVDEAPADARAMVEIDRDGRRREFPFGEVSSASARLAGTLAGHGIGRGDVVLTLIGNRPQWVLVMVACFRIGVIQAPLNISLKAADLDALLQRLQLFISARRPSMGRSPRLTSQSLRHTHASSSARLTVARCNRGRSFLMAPAVARVA